MSAIPGFVSLFYHKDNYESAVNKTNPVGTKGLSAHSFNELLSDMLSGNYKVVVPSRFRNQISSIAPQFRGYNQHDAQEFIAVVLNSLHEDLLVPENPRVEKSAVLDLFGGMYKSTVTCDECHTDSTKYEPFLTLPVPVPEKEIRKVLCTFFPANAAPINLAVRANKSGNTGHLYTKLAELLSISYQEGLFAGIQLSGHFGSCYEISANKVVSTFREKDRALIFENSGATEKNVACFSFRRGRMSRPSQFGVPFLIFCDPANVSVPLVKELVSRRLRTITNANVDPVEIRIIKFGGSLEGSK